MIRVREYAVLTSDNAMQPSMDVGVVSPATLHWLHDLNQSWRGKDDVLAAHNKYSVKLGSYVGYLESPIGECIEILPKTQHCSPSDTEIARSRQLLRAMLLNSLNLKPRESGAAHLQRMNTPLHEWIIGEYLRELSSLVKRGLRFDYLQVEEESRFIRGQIDQARQSRQTIDRATWFHIRHDIYSPSRPENRLLRTALDYALKLTKDAENWRLANELAHQLAEINPYREPVHYLPQWKPGKLMQTYETIKPWCEIILEKLNPNFQKGSHKGISLMFPMELLFENYVFSQLRSSITVGSKLKPQVSSQYLVTHHPLPSLKKQNWFQLKPDLLLSAPTGDSVMDTKWKLLSGDQSTSKDKYNLSQSDLYQLFAYGQKYMHGRGDMMLIYPKHEGFLDPLPKFSFDDQLHLWVVPFDLECKSLVGGEWERSFSAITLPGVDRLTA